MSIQLLNGLILLNGGSVATDSNCCCNDPCIECNPCPTCWDSLSDPCAEVDSVGISISGATNGTRSDCSCTGINATYTLDVINNPCTYYQWDVISGCVVPITAFFRLSYDVTIRAAWQFIQADLSIANQSELDASGLIFSTNAKFCNAITLYAGHYVRVIVTQRVIIPSPFVVQSFEQHYFYSFNNSDIKPGCPDDQVYGLCSGLGSGGTATHVFSTKSTSGGSVTPTSCYDNFGFPELCDLSGLSVTIGTPLITVTPPPPPPP